ncbi:MAG TPA: substrate-binding domain-containing protein [Intrasporangium sp.]|uniref:substrate-binding domain-containing protein n=1 Tax=Intrasporangium sp. TaxID=1925024 RepID=UPI002D79ED86|nr:substrate-binding domain-containing protein [Intrasporangium sp.]HET7399079.1 substrate-binding domain-containing protein [Intrasporangium sp.]
MNRHCRRARFLAVAGAGALSLTLAACGSSASPSPGSSGAGGTAGGQGPSWCGPKKIVLGMTDGFGGNSWRLVTTASAKDEASKCPSVTDFQYADGQGNTQKAIADIQGMVAKGVNALVVFPDAGPAILPALRSAHAAGVVTVPYRVDPGGKAGSDFDVFVDTKFADAGRNWGEWIKKILPNGGNVLFLSGPPGNSQGRDEGKGLHEVLEAAGKYTFIGEQPFEVTNWDPAQTQKVLTAAIAQNKQIDVIVSDFGPSLVGALPVFEQSGRSIPAIAASDGNVLSCFYEDHKAKNPDFKLFTVSTQNDHSRLAIDQAVARATGGKVPESSTFPSVVFEDSESKDKPVQCKRDLPADVYLSAELPGTEQAKLLK